MNSFELVTAKPLISGYQHKDGVIAYIYSDIFFVIDEDKFFQHQNWNDFTSIVLTWWLNALGSQSDYICLGFMDGPYKMILNRDKNVFNASLFINNKCDFICVFDYSLFIKEILLAANNVIRFIKKNNMHITEFDKLNRAYTYLQKQQKIANI